MNALQSAISAAITAIPVDGETYKADVDPAQLSSAEIAQCIDHTQLKFDATEADIDVLCDEARQWGFKTVCVRLPFVARCVANLQGSGVGVACVVGFHEGTYSTTDKLREAASALEAGATELDIVLNHALLVSSVTNGNQSDTRDKNSTLTFDSTTLATIQAELHALRALSRPATQSAPPASKGSPRHPQPSNASVPAAIMPAATPATSARTISNHGLDPVTSPSTDAKPTLKLILETSALAPHSYPSLVIAAVALAHDAQLDFVKTSTGFAGHGARTRDVGVMAQASAWFARQDGGPAMRVKASGGIRTLNDAKDMIAVGASRLGVSAGVTIVKMAMEMEEEAEDGESKGRRMIVGGSGPDATPEDGY